MMSPDIVMAISLLVLFMLLGISLGFWSLLVSHITFCLPFCGGHGLFATQWF